MELLDANIVLRYLLKDHDELYSISKQVIEKRNLYIPAEVTAEIVYVLEKVYEVPRFEITDTLKLFFNYQNIMTFDDQVLHEALDVYHLENIDFVDALLVGYHRIHKYQIHTFDKRVKVLCQYNDT